MHSLAHETDVRVMNVRIDETRLEVDLMDGYQRRLKKSAAWLKQVATTHVVD